MLALSSVSPFLLFVQSGTPAHVFVPPTLRDCFSFSSPLLIMSSEIHPETCLPADSKSGHPGSKDWLSQILGKNCVL